MFTLSIEDTVEIPVKFTLKAKKVNKLFSFNLTAERQPQDVLDAWFADKDRKVIDLLQEHVTGWSGQQLVMNGDKAADFSAEAFAAMLNVPGVAGQIFTAYVSECAAKAKN
jgi:hypothetical protein